MSSISGFCTSFPGIFILIFNRDLVLQLGVLSLPVCKHCNFVGGMEGQWVTQHENRTTNNCSILRNIIQCEWQQLIANIFENNTTH